MSPTPTTSWGLPHYAHHGTACEGKEENERGCTSPYRAAFMTFFVLWGGRREELCFHSFAFVTDSLPLQLNGHYFKAQPQIDSVVLDHHSHIRPGRKCSQWSKGWTRRSGPPWASTRARIWSLKKPRKE